jgi:hypothetical protein
MLLAAIVGVVVTASAQQPMHVWVIEPPNRIVEYDVATFTPVASIAVPVYAAKHSEYLKINAAGQLLFEMPRGLALGDAPDAAGRIWFWDGKRGGDLPAQDREAFLSLDGRSLVWFANAFAIDKDPDGNERSVRTSARVWRTDLAGGNDTTLISIPQSPRCQCGTGVCSESCPEWQMWAPDGVVDRSLVLTQWTPGQLEPSYQQSIGYRRADTRWEPSRFASALEHILTSDAEADTLVATVRDAGCCGWINESSDQTVVVKAGQRTVVFDEFKRFDHADYDISFYTTAAAIAPGRTLIAHSIESDRVEDEIRLSSDGKTNNAALTRIRAAAAQLPLTEIVDLGAPSRAVASIPHAKVIGWLNDRELLVVESGLLAVYDAGGRKIRTTTVAVKDAVAFLR